MENEVDLMTTNEMARLSDWLKSKGHTAEEIIDCIHYIADTKTNLGVKNQAPQPSTEEA